MNTEIKPADTGNGRYINVVFTAAVLRKKACYTSVGNASHGGGGGGVVGGGVEVNSDR